MSIPTQRAGPKVGTSRETGRTEAERRGFTKAEMPPAEHERRHARIAGNSKPGRYVPMKARK